MFQHELELSLSSLRGVKNLVDDIFVWGASKAEHDLNLFNLLDRMVMLGLTAHPDKCVFRQESFEFFGLQFSVHGVALTNAKVRAIKDAKQPITGSELRSFLGLVS